MPQQAGLPAVPGREARQGVRVGQAALRRERDRRLVPRIHLRLLVVLALFSSAAALLTGGGVPLLAGVDPALPAATGWALALVHATAGAALLHPSARRFGAAGAGALLLGWMAFMGATARTVPAVATGVLLAFALSAAAPEDEGPWRERDRGWPAEGLHALRLLGLGLFSLWLLGPPLAYVLPVAGAVLHRRALRRFGGPPPLARVLLLWLLLFWVGAGAVWAVAGVEPAGGPVGGFPGWPAWGREGPELLAGHLAVALAGILSFRAGPRLRVGIALAAALFSGSVVFARAPGALGGVVPAALLATALLAVRPDR